MFMSNIFRIYLGWRSQDNNKTLKILTEFTSNYNSKHYGRAIASKLKMNQKNRIMDKTAD